MGATAVISAILTLVAGIGIFLIACEMMSSNLESASSGKLKALFAKASGSKLLGVGIGALGTAAIQSSGEVTVMVIGFVNASIISLKQAATIIYGANIGTTITAQIVALGMFGGGGISTSIIFSAFAGVGAFTAMFAKKEMLKKLGGILTGFGMLFVGLEMMSGSMADFAALDAVKSFLAQINNPIILVLLGAVFTAIIQSSSVMTSIALAMVVTGLISLNQGIFLTMGSNIGSCVVAVIAGITSGKNAKRTALIHLFFNISGVVIFLLISYAIGLFTGNSVSFGSIFDKMFPGAPQTQLAMFHTIFNVCTVVIMLPLTTALVNIVCKFIPDEAVVADPNAPHLYYIDENMLKTPPVAVQQTKAEIVNMASIAIKNFNMSLDIICTQDFSKVDEFRKNEKELDFLNVSLIDFVVKLSDKQQLSQKDRVYLATTYRSIRDLERIGDYAENVVEYADTLKNVNMSFSLKALDEIKHLRVLINELYENTMVAYKYEDLTALELANSIEDKVDGICKMMEDNHIKRLAEGVCTPEVGAQYLSLSTNAERVADHLINVAKSIRKVAAFNRTR
ncbi:MAG: Na/Pi cotransporter family protein [Bacteroidales bacterium]|nr:Na/Pi cotransporter family protein [Bacteroidales bacterium]